MSARWSAESVLALAPDDASRRAAIELARAGRWSGTGAVGDLVWGLCPGSARTPYQAIADLTGPAYRCSCPSRKSPCKHALALLLLWAAHAVPDEPAPADYALGWVESRREKAQSNSLSGTNRTGSPTATRRAEERAQRVTGGLAELQEWLRDQVRVGLAASVSAADRHTETIAARMVDAQAPGVAGALRGLSGVRASGEDWPARLLAGYARLHLLARAYEHLETLPDGLAAAVRSRVGYTTSRQQVLTLPAVSDHWLVIAVRDLVEGTVPGRRIWLRGRNTGRLAMLLTFAGNGFWQDPETARLRAGAELDADLHFYPGEPPLRALAGPWRAAPAPGTCPEPADDVVALLTGWADGLAADPWLTAWPALLTGTPVPPGRANAPWYLVDQAGAALPMAEQESLWTLLAVSGGDPVTVAGEWHGDRLAPLTVWHKHQAVPL